MLAKLPTSLIYYIHVHATMETCVILGNIDFVQQKERLHLELRYQKEGLKDELAGKAGKRLDNRF